MTAKRSWKRWTAAEDRKLKRMVKSGKTTREIHACFRGRTFKSILQRRKILGIHAAPPKLPAKRRCHDCKRWFRPWVTNRGPKSLSVRCPCCSKQGRVSALCKSERELAIERYMAGDTSRSLANRFGVCPETIARIMAKAGVARKRGRRPS